MNKILKYVILILIGIILYTILNTYEKFNIGIRWVYLNKVPYEPKSMEMINHIGYALDRMRNTTGYYQEIQDTELGTSQIKVGYLLDAGEPPILSFSPSSARGPLPDCDSLNTNLCYTRKIDISDDLNSESNIDIYSQNAVGRSNLITKDPITRMQFYHFDNHFDDVTSDPSYKLVITDNLSLLKIYSMINKYYIIHKDDPETSILQPILYFSCHSEYIDTPFAPVGVGEDRDLEYHTVKGVDDIIPGNTGCSLQYVINLLSGTSDYQQTRPDLTSDIVDWGEDYITRYHIPLHYRNKEFETATENAFLNCNNCFMVILYKGLDNNYYQYGSDILIDSEDLTKKQVYNKQLNIMRMFGLTTYVYNYYNRKEVPIMLKSYNSLKVVNKFPMYNFYDTNALWSTIIYTLLHFDNGIKVKKDNGTEYNEFNYPLKLFIDGCVKYKINENIENKCTFRQKLASHLGVWHGHRGDPVPTDQHDPSIDIDEVPVADQDDTQTEEEEHLCELPSPPAEPAEPEALHPPEDDADSADDGAEGGVAGEGRRVRQRCAVKARV